MGRRARETLTNSIVIYRFGIWGIFWEALSNLYRIGGELQSRLHLGEDGNRQQATGKRQQGQEGND